jgi:ABC-2 type transport system ATP-binding protein
MLVQTESLAKLYGPVAALVDCTLAVEAGEILGLLGPNGAGKTTLLRLLLGYLKPSSGHARIDGLDCYRNAVDVHRRLSYLPGDARLFRQLDGRDTLRFFADLRPGTTLARGVALAERMQLDLSRRVGQMSTGMRQKLALVIALAPEAPLVILDEPTANLDPTIRREVTDLIRDTRSRGTTVLFSSHVLSEVEDACDRVVVLRAGRLVDSVRVHDVLRQHRIRAELRGELTPPPADIAPQLAITHRDNGAISIVTAVDLAPVLGWLARQPLAQLQIEPIGLRAVYERHHPAGAA